MQKLAVSAWLVAQVFLPSSPLALAQDLPAEAIDFARDIRPILVERCEKCHGPEKQKGGLRLDDKASAFKGGDSGPVIFPGKSGESLLFQAITGLDPDRVMPPRKGGGEPLATNQVALIARWIDAGASWPDELAAALAQATRSHWSFKPPQRPPVPQPKMDGFKSQNPIDAFVAAAHEQRGLTASPEASRRTLIRRLSLDLTGLPPASREVAAFVTDNAPDAYERLVERLLASPHYGERWGRFWLDLARWAESDGYEANDIRPHAWRYRDYVVKSFNADKPYDRFLREQIAGDELEPYSDEHLVATGFLAATRTNNNEEDKAVQLNEPLVDIANTTASITLGLTLNCAQCHDHKFEPLTIRNYYAWHGFFKRGQVNDLLLRDPAGWEDFERNIPPEYSTAKLLREQLEARGRESLLAGRAKTGATNTPSPKRDDIRAQLPEPDRKLLAELDKKISDLEKQLNQRKPQTWGFYSPATSPHAVTNLTPRGQYPFSYQPAVLKTNQAVVLQRGDVHRAGETVTPGVPEILRSLRDDPAPAGNSRAALADWLTSTNSPLTARVWVNLVWQQHFGRGLVASSGDFGTRGERPTHPELLDWLACEFRERGWSTKQLHRLIVTSRTYRQASQPSVENSKRDPDNHFLWRWLPRRLEAEAVRDSILAAAGQLDFRAGGPGDKPDSGSRRRSLYLLQQRHHLPAAQALFDAPTASESCVRRHVSTVPLQPLFLLNNREISAHAETFAACVRALAGVDSGAQVEVGFDLALGRPPDEEERAFARRFFQTTGEGGESSRTLAHFCQALLNLNEFVYLE